jgi:hypothetical protein
MRVEVVRLKVKVNGQMSSPCGPEPTNKCRLMVGRKPSLVICNSRESCFLDEVYMSKSHCLLRVQRANEYVFCL